MRNVALKRWVTLVGSYLRFESGPDPRFLDPRLAPEPSGPLRVFSAVVIPIPHITDADTVPTQCWLAKGFKLMAQGS